MPNSISNTKKIRFINNAMYLARYLRQETPLLQYLLESKKEEGSDIKIKSYSKMQWSKLLKVNLQEKKKTVSMSSLKVIISWRKWHPG